MEDQKGVLLKPERTIKLEFAPGKLTDAPALPMMPPLPSILFD
jgi:hypothetical protein